jgi:hypothetical protein
MGHMKFPLPAEPNPESSICIQVLIPNEVQYVANFWGNFWNLCSAANHGDDPGHTALAVAAKWQDVYEAALASGCAQMDVRQNPTQPCILEKKSDDTWEQFADLKLCPPMFRNHGGKLQYSTDGGTTWQDVTSEPPEQGTYSPKDTGTMQPPRGGSNIPCLAARNAAECLHQLHTYMVNWYETYATALTIAQFLQAIIVVFLPLDWWIGLAIIEFDALANHMLENADALNTGAWDEDVTQVLTCILFCNADTYGRWNQAEFNEILLELQLKDAHIYNLIKIWLEEIIGIVGLNNAGVTNSIASYDCGICTCGYCYEWDFTQSPGGWSIGESGHYSAGIGYVGDDYNDQSRADIEITLNLNSFDFQQPTIMVLWGERTAQGDVNANVGLGVRNIAGWVIGGREFPGPVGVNIQTSRTGSGVGTLLYAQLNSGTVSSVNIIRKIRLYSPTQVPEGWPVCS